MQPITESVYASVNIEPDQLYEVHAVVSGIISEVYVKEGDTIQINQAIAQISNTSSKLNAENAQLALKLAKDNLSGPGSVLKSLKDRIQTAKITHHQDSIDFMRQKRLWDQNIGTAAQFDQRKLAYEVSKQTLQSLYKEYERTETELKSMVNQAQNNYENALKGNSDFTITSRMKGRVYSVFKEPGELISPQEPLATIGKSEAFIIKMQVDEVDITKVKTGQKVILKLDAFEDQTFEAYLTRILPQKNTRTQTFLIEADFVNQPNNLYSGLSGEANIIVSQKSNALVIPRRFLQDGNVVKTDSGQVPVEVGMMNMEYAEILSGVDTTTVIYLP
ncbi:HlyD family efflux transporter periplasmic adaptor subunit [Fulvivirga lutimaris]|nr:HlyD family efflux transporter periplasmic adaptor subunit [Fulvivirga lutimaris]